MQYDAPDFVLHFFMRWLCFLLLAFIFCSCACEKKEVRLLTDNIRFVESVVVRKQKESSDVFELRYSYAGLGSQFGTLQPVFEVHGCQYELRKEQNSYWGKPSEKPQFICKGFLRPSSVDSVVRLVAFLRDTTIQKTDPDILSGGVHSLSIQARDINVSYRLHNIHDPIAAEVLEILNSNLPEAHRMLWIFPPRPF